MVAPVNRFGGIRRWLDGSRRQIRRGDRARDAGDYRRAANFYARALRRMPGNGAIHVQAGHMFKEAGDLASAERHYLQAAAISPDDRDAHLHLAHLYKNSDQPAAAYSHFLRLSELDPAMSGADLERARRRLSIVTPVTPEMLAAAAAPLEIDTPPADRLIDPRWYRERYPDVGEQDPVRHFHDHGRLALRRPGPGFDPDWYLAAYPHVAESGLDPFTHYREIGRASGFKPVGPQSYRRWVAEYDTLGSNDRSAIDAHIAEAGLAPPTVLALIDAATAATLDGMIRGLRASRLAPRRVHLCLAPDCPPAARRSLAAIVVDDDRFRVVDVGQPLMDDAAAAGAPLVLIDAAIELREHALYMLVQAIGTGGALVYADNDRLDADGARQQPVFRPDASPELLRQTAYMGACALLPGDTDVARLATTLTAGGTSADTAIRSVARGLDRADIIHLPFVLYHDAIERVAAPSQPGPRLADAALPTVSIIIPTRDRLDLLKPCVESLVAATDYPADRLDIVVIDNGSVETETIDWLAAQATAGRIRTIRADIAFNYARLNNMAAATCATDILVLLNNDTEIGDPDWLRGLVGYAVQPDIGAVGPKLLYGDDTIQHAGMVLGVGGVAIHAHLGLDRDAPGSLGLAQRTREVAAVTGACLAIARAKFAEIGGLDENLPAAFNDVLLCAAAIDHGYRNLYVHDVWVRHYESRTRGIDDTPERVAVFVRDARYSRETYPRIFAQDPWYNPNLSFEQDKPYAPAFPPRVHRPWRAFARRDRKRRVLILSATFDERCEIGAAATLQARYLRDGGAEVVLGSRRPADAAWVYIRDGLDAAGHAVRDAFDLVIAHTPDYADIGRWLDGMPAVVLQYHGAAAERSAGCAADPLQSLNRTLALPLNARIVAPSIAAAQEIEVGTAEIVPPGADRLGRWSAGEMPLRDTVRETLDWHGRTVILAACGPGPLTEATRTALESVAGLIERDAAVVMLFGHTDAVSGETPVALGHAAPQTIAERRQVFAAADVYWELDPAAPLIDRLEAEAMGLPVVASHDRQPAPLDPSRIAGTLVAAGGRGAAIWSRRAGAAPGWAERLARFGTLVDGLDAGTGLSAAARQDPATGSAG